MSVLGFSSLVLASRGPEFLPMQRIGRKVAASAAIALGLAIGFAQAWLWA